MSEGSSGGSRDLGRVKRERESEQAAGGRVEHWHAACNSGTGDMFSELGLYGQLREGGRAGDNGGWFCCVRSLWRSRAGLSDRPYTGILYRKWKRGGGGEAKVVGGAAVVPVARMLCGVRGRALRDGDGVVGGESGGDGGCGGLLKQRGSARLKVVPCQVKTSKKKRRKTYFNHQFPVMQ